MADITLTLGGIELQDFEIPDRIAGLGGDQKLVVQTLVGGDRDVQAMGRDDAPITWAGRFRGSDAVGRARAIDAMRAAGAAVDLTFGDFSFAVAIERFVYEFERFYEIPYIISLVVITDQSSDADTSSSGPGVDEMLRVDNATAGGLGDRIADGPLSGALGSLDSAIGAVSDFAKATQATIQGVLAPIAAVQGRVLTLISSAENTLQSVTTLGGVAPGLLPSGLASGLTSQLSAMGRAADLYDLGNVVGRMSTNLQAIGQSGAYVTQAGGDLYRMARDAYGDASEWATIARANGLADPELSGVQKILVPPISADTAGVLAT